MKTTVAVDEAKLVDLMKLTGLKTRKAAIDFALTEAMRAATLRPVLGSSIFVVPDSEPVVDPKYDLLKLREAEKPRCYSAAKGG
jgi:Bacterial antitoxin of type II TA system, VapB